VWNQSVTLRLTCPELALVSLAVWDKDNGPDDDFIASVVLPAAAIRPGYRRVSRGHSHLPMLVAVCLANQR
jgi:hypothetical protein